jgi:hypothetical protein
VLKLGMMLERWEKKTRPVYYAAGENATSFTEEHVDRYPLEKSKCSHGGISIYTI